MVGLTITDFQKFGTGVNISAWDVADVPMSEVGGRPSASAKATVASSAGVATFTGLTPNTDFIVGPATGTWYQVRGTTKSAAGYQEVASAAAVTLPTGADVVSVTGTTNITSMAAGAAGRRVTLIFAGVLTFTDGSNLKLAGNYTTSADDTITLVSDGTNWYETSRSTN